MRREVKRQLTRQLLLDTTQDMIQEKGCGQITLQDIMERSGLSKGAIYHYVKSKDELLAWVLQDRLEGTNRLFYQAANHETKTYEAPMQAIINNLSMLADSKDVTNQIVLYLMSKNDQPAVNDVLQKFYQLAVEMSKQWIVTGQREGIIPHSVHSDQISHLFVLISLGVRVRSTFATDTSAFGIPEIAEFMTSILQPKH